MGLPDKYRAYRKAGQNVSVEPVACNSACQLEESPATIQSSSNCVSVAEILADRKLALTGIHSNPRLALFRLVFSHTVELLEVLYILVDLGQCLGRRLGLPRSLERIEGSRIIFYMCVQ